MSIQDEQTIRTFIEHEKKKGYFTWRIVSQLSKIPNTDDCFIIERVAVDRETIERIYNEEHPPKEKEK